MATSTSTATFTKSNDPTAQHGYPREPLKSKGVLNAYKSFEVTPVIGREFVDVSLKEWLRAPNSDELIRDLAITSKLHSTISKAVTANRMNSLSAWCCLLSQAG
jgi:hypothetical protein